jgi:hypothetical protein
MRAIINQQVHLAGIIALGAALCWASKAPRKKSRLIAG